MVNFLAKWEVPSANRSQGETQQLGLAVGGERSLAGQGQGHGQAWLNIIEASGNTVSLQGYCITYHPSWCPCQGKYQCFLLLALMLKVCPHGPRLCFLEGSGAAQTPEWSIRVPPECSWCAHGTTAPSSLETILAVSGTSSWPCVVTYTKVVTTPVCFESKNWISCFLKAEAFFCCCGPVAATAQVSASAQSHAEVLLVVHKITALQIFPCNIINLCLATQGDIGY